MGKIILEKLECTKTPVMKDKPGYLTFKVTMTGRKGYGLVAVPRYSPDFKIELKTGKTSGVWRDTLFLGDLNDGESKTFLVRATMLPWSTPGLKDTWLDIKEGPIDPVQYERDNLKAIRAIVQEWADGPKDPDRWTECDCRLCHRF